MTTDLATKGLGYVSQGPRHPYDFTHLLRILLLRLLVVLGVDVGSEAVDDVLGRKLDLLGGRHDLPAAGQEEHAADQRALRDRDVPVLVVVLIAARRVLEALEEDRLEVFLVQVLVEDGEELGTIPARR